MVKVSKEKDLDNEVKAKFTVQDTGIGISESNQKGLKMNVLVVDDNSVNQKLALHILKKYAFRVDRTANGEKAITYLGMPP